MTKQHILIFQSTGYLVKLSFGAISRPVAVSPRTLACRDHKLYSHETHMDIACCLCRDVMMQNPNQNPQAGVEWVGKHGSCKRHSRLHESCVKHLSTASITCNTSWVDVGHARSWRVVGGPRMLRLELIHLQRLPTSCCP